MKIRSVGAELYHADRRTNGRTDEDTDMTKLTVVSRNFENPPSPNMSVSMCGLENGRTYFYKTWYS